MCNPISQLQELCVHSMLPIPCYNFMIISENPPRFQCTVRVNDRVMTASASSKKAAKTEAAQKLLVCLKKDIKKGKSQTTPPRTYESPSLMNDLDYMPMSTHLPEATDTDINSVGKLNEYCAKAGLPYPIYGESGMKVNMFVMICNHLDFSTTGMGTTKKTAKQNAAYEMLIKIDSIKPRNSLLDPPLTPSVYQEKKINYNIPPNSFPKMTKKDEEMVKIYDSHCVTSPENQTTDIVFHNPFVDNLIDLSTDDHSKSISTQTSPSNHQANVLNSKIEEIEKKLRKIGIICHPNILFTDPYVVSCRVHDKNFSGISSTYEESKLNLLNTIWSNFGTTET